MSRNAWPGSPLLLLMSLVPRLITTACGSTWKSHGRRGRVVDGARVDHRHRAARVAAVVADDAAAGRRDRADLGAERAPGHRRVGVPVALRGKAVAVGERAEVAVAAGDRIADELDQAVRPGGRIHQRAVADGQSDEARVALRPLRLPVELDGVRARRQPRGEHAHALPRRRERRLRRAVDDRLEDLRRPGDGQLGGQRRPREARHEPAARPGEARLGRHRGRVDAAEPAHARRDDARGRLHRVRIDRRRARIHGREARVGLVAVWIGRAARGGGDRGGRRDHSKAKAKGSFGLVHALPHRAYGDRVSERASSATS